VNFDAYRTIGSGSIFRRRSEEATRCCYCCLDLPRTENSALTEYELDARQPYCLTAIRVQCRLQIDMLENVQHSRLGLLLVVVDDAEDGY
jgi:hypothetical protein